MAEQYPPEGIAAGVAKLPEWIQLGCGDKPYNCPEKNATFAPDGVCPPSLPDLSKHSNVCPACIDLFNCHRIFTCI